MGESASFTTAYSPIGLYQIRKDSYGRYWLDIAAGKSTNLPFFKTLAEAIAAAEEHKNKVIGEWLV